MSSEIHQASESEILRRKQATGPTDELPASAPDTPASAPDAKEEKRKKSRSDGETKRRSKSEKATEKKRERSSKTSSEQRETSESSKKGKSRKSKSANRPSPAIHADDQLSRKGLLQGTGACGFSMIVHVIGLIILGYMFVSDAIIAEEETVVASVVEEIPDEEVMKIELDEEIEPVDKLEEETVSQSPAMGAMGNAAPSQSIAAIDKELVERLEPTPVQIGTPAISMPSTSKAIKELPQGALGDSRSIVDDYSQAMDRITQEILWSLDRSDVLVVWCFDQSESMKDDQKEIRQRINRVYEELGLTSNSQGEHLVTAVTSYGARQLIHTKKPTSNLELIRKAIDSVPIDPSGKENMCEAIGMSIRRHRQFTRRRRQMMLIVVSDESGEPQSNNAYLEDAINEAKAARCKLYFLGREAVFGYPFAHIRWTHPQTKHVHWLPVNRGPETAFVEQLQTSGLRRRYDAFSSGFGPYEQSRMARETGGIFFMLPSVEAKLVRGEKRRYELEAMQAYRPDLRSRQEVFLDRDNHPLRTLITGVIADLNPYNKQSARVIELRHHFSKDPKTFVKQVREEQAKAKLYLTYLVEASKAMESDKAKALREQELSPRWQANYDIIRAQLIGYQARVFEYGASLDAFIAKPKIVPLKKGKASLVHWDIGSRKLVITGEISAPYIKESTRLYREVIKKHPGTPWAARAQWEINRGFGIDLNPHYRGPTPKVTGRLLPVSKL